MKNLTEAFTTKPLIIYLILSLVAVSTFAGPAEAMLVPAPSVVSTASEGPSRTADMLTIRAGLETKVLQQRLQDYGLTPAEALERISSLSNEQVHQLAANMQSVQAGGDAVGFLLTLALIAALVVLIIFLLEGRIEIRQR